MKLYGFRKIDLKTMSEEPEEIHTEYICYYFSVRSKPVVCLKDGRQYYLADSFELYKKVLESKNEFQTVDRCYSVKMDTVKYYNPEENYLHFNDNIENVYVARRYKDLVLRIIKKLGIKIN